jgi:hypothetical protein
VTEEGDDEACSGDGSFFSDGKSSDGDACGHLGDGEEGVESAKRFSSNGNTQNGKRGEGGCHSGQVCGTPSASDDDSESSFLGGAGVCDEAKRSSVGTDDAGFGRNPCAAEKSLGGLEGGPVGSTTHDDSDKWTRMLQESDIKYYLIEVKNFGVGLLGKGLENDGGSDEFGKELGWGVGVGAKEDVGGNSFASVFLEGGGDGGVASGPVGHEEGDILFAKGGLNFGLRESESFVDLAGEAPSGGEVDEDGATGGELAGDFSFGPGEAVERISRGGGGGCGFQEEGRDESGEEDENERGEAQEFGRRKRFLGFAEKDEADGEEKESEEDGQSGGATGEAGGDPEKPEDGGEHGEGENFFESIHPGSGFGEEGEEGWDKRKEENGEGEADGKEGKDEESA